MENNSYKYKLNAEKVEIRQSLILITKSQEWGANYLCDPMIKMLDFPASL